VTVRRQVLLVTALFATGASGARADWPAADPVKVPFQMLQKGRYFSGHIAVQAKVNGKGPYRLIFDTGAPIVLLSNKVAKEAGLFDGGKRPAGAGSLLMPGQVRVGKLEIGPLAAADVSAVVLDHPTVKAIAEVFGPIDGIVGFPFFARYRTAIDYRAKELTFTPNGYKPADVVQAMMAAMMGPVRTGKEPPRLLAPAAQWGLRVEKSAGDSEPGVTVAEVFAGGAAAAAGVQAGDRLLTLDGRWTDTVADCYEATATVKPGEAVELTLRRGGKVVPTRVTPAAGM
jgi:hypothetical protein